MLQGLAVAFNRKVSCVRACRDFVGCCICLVHANPQIMLHIVSLNGTVGSIACSEERQRLASIEHKKAHDLETSH